MIQPKIICLIIALGGLVIISCIESGDTDSPSSVNLTPLMAYDMGDGLLGDTFLNWTKSTYDDNRSVSNGMSIKITTTPGEVLPTCSGSHQFAGRTVLDPDQQIPTGKTLWFRAMFYIPSTFSFGHKYSGNIDNAEAGACGQHADGNLWIKWMVLSPTLGTGRVYLSPSGQRRNAELLSTIRLIPEATHQPEDIDAAFPLDQWFALQIAVKVSSGSDGFIRAWINDTFLGEMSGQTFTQGSSIYDWGVGDYWNGVPWTDGDAGRDNFWMDEVILATDMDGYGAPTTLDSGGRPYIPFNARVADFL